MLRGARASSEAAPVALASAALDASLMTEGAPHIQQILFLYPTTMVHLWANGVSDWA